MDLLGALRFCCILNIAFLQMTTTQSVSATIESSFHLQPNPTIGVTRLGPTSTCRSRAICASKCLYDLANCRSFLFNKYTGHCTPCGFYKTSEALPTPEEGDLYMRNMGGGGFQIKSYKGTSAKVGVFGPKSTYDIAQLDCESRGGFLASVKNTDKLNIITQIAGNIEIWVGCNDKEKEGTYVWEEDGESFIKAARPAGVFNQGEPYDNGGEDCIVFIPSKLYDVDCTKQHKYICELSMPVT